MPSLPKRIPGCAAAALPVAALVLAALSMIILPATARADDKELLVGGGCEGPNVFALMDISNTMNKWVDEPSWAPEPYAEMKMDDPAGRYYQVREALFEVLKSTSGVHFGFAVFPNVHDYEAGKSCTNVCLPDDPPTSCTTVPCPDTWDNRCCIDPPNESRSISCQGWEPNGDDSEDEFEGSNFLFPTTIDSATGLEYGDVVPLNWNNTNRWELMKRMAPNIVVDGEDNPKFEINNYFEPEKSTCPGGADARCLLDEDQRPLPQFGSSPYQAAMKDFIDWYDAWKVQAAAADPDFANHETALLILGDFDLGCAGDEFECEDLPSSIPCDVDEDPITLARTAQIYKGTEDVNTLCPDIASEVLGAPGYFGDGRNIKVYVISFASQLDPGDTAELVAKCGGTEAPYTPQTKEELIEVLGGIIQTVKSGSKSFSPAATPPRSHNAEDKVAFTSFLPIADTSFWDGHLKAFLRPVPVDAAEKPDDSIVCGGSVTDACFLWDAGDQLVAQAPTAAEVAVDTLELGPGANQRRVWFTMEKDSSNPDSVTRSRELFGWDGTTSDDVKDDLIIGMGIVGGGGFCGDSSCGLGETSCNCAADCGGAPASETGLCIDGVDNDCDTNVDCDDSDCSGDFACAFCGDSTCDSGETQCTCPSDCGSPPANEVGVCDDSVDNDCDTDIDCDDADCTSDPVCFSCGNSTCDPGETQCSCSADCGSPPAVETGLCTDSVDNDCDSLLDCGDPDCAADASCSSCGNSICDAGETSCDCPGDCGAPPGSETGLCGDSIDNDCDGNVDCDDADCSADAACGGGGGSCAGPGGNFDIWIATGDDDVEEDGDNGEMNLDSSDLDLTDDGWGGLRFVNLPIPVGAQIDYAHIDLEEHYDHCCDSPIEIWAFKTGHAVEFTEDDYNASSRTRTDASVVWQIDGETYQHDRYQTPDLKDLVQEVVDEPGWDEGNAIGFFLMNSGDKRDFYAYDDEPDQAAFLRVTYSCSGSRPAPAALVAEPEEWERAQDVIRETLRIKTATVNDEDTNTDVDISYVLGDVFHSDPVVAGPPGEGRFYATDFMSNDKACDDSSDPNPGYRCFYEKHQYRRQVLLYGANDGQVHAADIGTFDYSTDPEVDGAYNNGTGRELFAHVPRGLLPSVLTQAEVADHNWGVDSPIRVVDVFIDPDHLGTPTENEREWRTVAIGGLRRGGKLYYALDITQPDELDNKGVGQPINVYVPSCWDGLPTSGCGPVAYGAPLWEFTDTWDEDTSAQTGNGHADLGDTWSEPNIWPLRVLVDDGSGGTEEAIKFVAIFGGGLDDNKLGDTGNWLYMVDIETGKPIYKRRLEGSAASEPAAVDEDGDGFLDTIYIGTISGLMYKVDVHEPKYLNPAATVDDYSTGSPPPTTRTVTRVIDIAWDPFAVFDTEGRPIYHPPSVIFVAKRNQFSIAFGTGDREDVLLKSDPAVGYNTFYNVVDDDFQAGHPMLPLTQDDLKEIAFDSALTEISDLLVNPDVGNEAGWALTLDTLEKVVTKSLAFGGVITFSTFTPNPAVTCGGAGSGKIYVVNSTNANPIYSPGGIETRYYAVDDFITDPYVESGGTPGPGGGDDDDDDDDDLCRGLLEVSQTLQTLYPSSCKFTNRSENMMAQRSDTGLECIAPVPVCVQGKNWREY